MKKMITNIKTSLIFKMIFIASCLLIIPGIVVLLLSCRVNYQSLREQMLIFNQQLMDVTRVQWEESMDEITEIPRLLYNIDPRLQNALRSTQKYEAGQREQLKALLATMLSSNSNLIGIEVKGNNEEILREYQFVSQTRWQTYAQDAEFEEGFQTYILEGESYFGVYHKTLIDYPSYEKLAEMTLYFPLEEWERHADKLGGGQSGYAIRLINEEGDTLYQYGEGGEIDAELAISSHMLYKGRMEKVKGYYFVGEMNVAGEDFKLIKFFPLSEITDVIWKVVMPLGILNAFLMTCMILYFYLVYRNVLHPVRRIVENMKKVQAGIYEYEAWSSSQDEIGRMDHQYEAMIRDIDYLVNQTMRHEYEIIQTKLKVLQAQINPHFLNNMLQMISTQAVCEDAEQTDKMLCSLARLLQYNMDTDRDEVMLEEEFKNIGHYLKLQNERYMGKIEVKMQVEKECRSINVPKMILQPLVENAIKYSYLKEGKPCKLKVTAQKVDNNVFITVADNGIGISEEKRQAISDLYAQNAMNVIDGHGIGLLNVLFRLRIYFQDRFSWEIIANYPGCIISLALPYIERGDLE